MSVEISILLHISLFWPPEEVGGLPELPRGWTLSPQRNNKVQVIQNSAHRILNERNVKNAAAPQEFVCRTGEYLGVCVGGVCVWSVQAEMLSFMESSHSVLSGFLEK